MDRKALKTAKIRMMVELEYEPEIMHGNDQDAKRWFMEHVLLDPNGLILHSNDIGDSVGTLRVLEVHPF